MTPRDILNEIWGFILIGFIVVLFIWASAPYRGG